MPSVSLTGLNLRAYLLGENDKIVVVFTRERGILRLAARGARKTGNKWSGRLEPLARNVVQVARGRGSLEVLAGAETRVSGAALLGDLDRLMVGLRMAEEICALVPEAEPIPEAFDAVETALDLLMARVRPDLVGLWFELALLEIAGYRPELDACAACGRDMPDGDAAYSIDAGGVSCPGCPFPAKRVAGATLALLRALREIAPDDLADMTPSSEVTDEASDLLTECIARNSQTELHASKIWRSLAT